MKRGCLSLLFAVVALAQVPSQDDPIQGAVQAYQSARDHGQFDEAAAKRELARSLLDQIPADSPQFGNSVWRVAQLYAGSGRGAQALAVAQQGLTRVTGREARIQLLQIIADFYQQDGNLLQAVVYREKLVAAMDEAADAPAPQETKPRNQTIAIISGSFRHGFSGSWPDSRTFAYERLADLYQELGRPESVAAINKRMIAIAKESGSLAQYYEHQGRLDEAAAIYKKQAEQADPSIREGALQSLANIYEQQQRYAEAADAMQQATVALNASGKPEARQQTVWNRMSMARALNRAGMTSAGDEIFEQILAEAGNASEATYLQVVNNYAGYLTETKRDAQGQALLSDYLNSHANLQPQDEANLLFQLANGARRSGDSKLADQYQQAAMAKQPTQTPSAPQILIGPDLQAAQAAANTGKVDEAYEIALHAMATAPQATDREQVSWMVPNLAMQLVAKKQPAKAEQLYQRLFGLVEAWSVDNPNALISVLQGYTRFLIHDGGRWNDAPVMFKRLYDVIVSAQGPASNSLGTTLSLRVEFERAHGTPQGTIAVELEMLAFQESRSGNTSEGYLNAAEAVGREYQSHGDPGNAIPIFRRNAEIADLAFRPNDVRRANARITAAMALAQLRQFDDAEKLATEAVEIAKAMRPPQGDLFVNSLGQIRKMRAAPQPNPAAGTNPWFRQSKSQDR